MATPAISGIDASGRLVVFVNGDFAHVPIVKALAANIASQAEAEAGTDNEKAMTPLRTAEAIASQVPAIVGEVIAADVLSGAAANTTASVPAGWAIDNIFFVNTTANPVTIKIGTTSGATDVVEAIPVGANAIVDTFQSLDFMLRKRLFNKSASQTLFIQSVGAWGGAVLDIGIKRTKIF